MIDPVISLDGLGKRFGHTIAVESISMVIGKGEIFGFLGANGAGKTTTIRMLCGLTRPTRGYGIIHGLEIWQDRFRLRSQFGYVPQRFSLYADLTVLENMRFFRAAYRVPRNQLAPRIERLLSVIDLAAQRDAKAGTLSGGLKQLLSISCALLYEPSLLFLDEPTVGLDPVHRQYIWDLLYKLSQRGATMVVTTHYVDEADRCTGVGFIQGGKLLAKGSPLALKRPLYGKLLEINVENVRDAMQILRRLPDVCGIELRNDRQRIQARDPEALLEGWLKHWPYAKLGWLGYTWVEPHMEDVFTVYSQGYHPDSGSGTGKALSNGGAHISGVGLQR